MPIFARSAATPIGGYGFQFPGHYHPAVGPYEVAQRPRMDPFYNPGYWRAPGAWRRTCFPVCPKPAGGGRLAKPAFVQ